MAAKNQKVRLGEKIRSARAIPASPSEPLVDIPPAKPEKPSSATTGKPAAVWFDDEDRAILRELSVLMLNQGIDPSHSLIVRVLLRLAPRDASLIDQARELIARDGRKLRHRKGKQS